MQIDEFFCLIFLQRLDPKQGLRLIGHTVRTFTDPVMYQAQEDMIDLYDLVWVVS